jgi:N-acetylmuramoyl-L-alanine amidase
VIDPGHGGEYDGAMGADSLSEADVNLGVALYLWGLLREAGTEVHMTRSADRDFLPEGAAASAAGLTALLRDDLAARIEIANEFEPEVFVSIHHNSNIALDRERNAVEIYYKGSDHGASLELATDVHTHLARNLGISTTTIKPGNYYVLRNSKAGAAVLGEASYISNAAVEDKLKLSAKQRLEAEAYYLGLIKYFSRGVPVIAMTEPETDTLTAPGKLEFTIVPGAGIPVDPASPEARIDGRIIDCFQPAAGERPFCLMPSSMPNGTFTISFSARSVRGATATYGPKKMLLDRPARFFLPMAPLQADDGRKILRVLVLDSGGRPVADGKTVTMRASSEKRGSTARTRKGVASFIRRGAGGTHIVSSGPSVETLAFPAAGPETEVLAMAVDDLTGMPVQRAVLRCADGKTLAGDRKGAIRSSAVDTAGAVIYATGYNPTPLEQMVEGGKVPVTRMTPVFSGVMHGKRIVIDPAGGGTDDAGRGAGALRGATVNMRLARELENRLTAAGASVLCRDLGWIPFRRRHGKHPRIIPLDRARSGCDITVTTGILRRERLISRKSCTPCPSLTFFPAIAIFTGNGHA